MVKSGWVGGWVRILIELGLVGCCIRRCIGNQLVVVTIGRLVSWCLGSAWRVLASDQNCIQPPQSPRLNKKVHCCVYLGGRGKFLRIYLGCQYFSM